MRKKNLRDEVDELISEDNLAEEGEEGSILARTPLPGDEEILLPSLRPRKFNEFIGQQAIVEKLRVFIAAARERGEPLDHTLLLGPPGRPPAGVHVHWGPTPEGCRPRGRC